MKNLKMIFLFTFLSIVFVTPFGVVSADDVIRWKLQTVDSASLPSYKILAQRFCERVKEASNGRLIITPYPAGALVPTFEVWDAMRRGMVDISYHFLVYWRGKEPALWNANEWVAYADRYQSAIWYYNGGGEELLRKTLEPHGLHYLGMTSGLWGECLWSKEKLDSPDALKGKKMRAAGLAADMATELGASVVVLPGSEVYQALEKGVVDVAEYTNPIVNYSIGLQEVAKYVVFPPYSGGGNYDWFVNSKKWQKLPSDLKSIVELCLNEASYLYSLENELETARVNNKLRAMKDVTFVNWTKEDMKKVEAARVRSMEKASQKSPLLKDILQSRMNILKELGYEGADYNW